VLSLEREIEGMHARIEEIELEALKAQVRLANELEEVRRSFRAELTVPYRGGLALVRAADARSPFRPQRGAPSGSQRRAPSGPPEPSGPAERSSDDAA
jgi:hypothetical protein